MPLLLTPATTVCLDVGGHQLQILQLQSSRGPVIGTSL
jgi:hypothetical protein